MNPDIHIRLRNMKELAATLGVSREFLLAMKRDGFAMPGGRATVAAAHAWLAAHPDFRVGSRHKKTALTRAPKPRRPKMPR